jgi:hypothetical protein
MSVQIDQPGNDDATPGVDDFSRKMAGYIGRNGRDSPLLHGHVVATGPAGPRAHQVSALDEEVKGWSPVPGGAYYSDRRDAQWKKVAMWSRTS